MVEVFKTNIDNHWQAYRVLELIRRAYPNYRPNFDLADSDRILRVECPCGSVNPHEVTRLLTSVGHFAEVLEDGVEVSFKNFQVHPQS